ncbi:alpha/beta hydrolase [Microbacterium sp. CFBP9034]|uniref:alpha/beta hydrolase n=1 Tax=Microbacterium sp. CFBP9034 TaxID=3096540 RepID=UPI002A6B6E36|nr:alpha/beta hydrolase [Microbacterium sp. CFBP9034]MDY0908588.1 alpha/beta hydrolase [Microbacterium sp. CFBP9034]
MDIDLIHPSLRDRTRRAPKLNLENRFVLTLVSTGSSLLRGKRVEGVERRVVREGDLRLRVYVPPRPTGAGLLWIHGGGLVLGAAAMDDTFCGQTARDLGVTIVSVDYRLAPKHPFPAAIDDARAGWGWMLRHAADLGLDLDRLAVGGQSAGGGLAASLVQRLHDEGERVAAQWLFCPMLDDRTAADRARDAEAHFVWSNRSNLVGWTSYLGGAPGADDLPPYAAAARRTDLSGLPPTWLYTSDVELFRDEDLDYARRLEAAGVDVTLDVVPGVPHGFEAWAADAVLATDLVSRARAWLGGRLTA